ncbi:hypothetical protein EV2_020725 [Malus domestica]
MGRTVEITSQPTVDPKTLKPAYYPNRDPKSFIIRRRRVEKEGGSDLSSFVFLLLPQFTTLRSKVFEASCECYKAPGGYFLRMNTVQITSCQPSNYFRNSSQSLRLSSNPYFLPNRAKCLLGTSLKPKLHGRIQQQCVAVLKKRQCGVVSKYCRSAPVCLLGGKGKNESGDEGSPWKALEKAMGNFKKEGSIEDVLRQQIEKNEFFEEKGGGRGGGGGSGGGDGLGGSGGSEDEGFSGIMDETLQVILATVGFIFLYVYIISGEEITRLAKDYIKFVFSGSKSIRLTRAMQKWGSFFRTLTEKKEYDKFWLEKAILTTPTAYDTPEKYRNLLRSNLEPDSDDDDDE